MSRSHSLVLALGLGQTYFFASTEGEWEFDDLPDSIDEALDPAVIKKVHWVSFGDSEDSWYLQYEDDQGLLRMKYGDDTPKILKEFLKRTNHVGMVKVVFGPHESFFAWSEDTVRWSDIPRGMEKTVQSWITSHGWRYGAPNIVTLGCKHSYFIASAQGAADYRVPHFLRQTTQSMVRWETDGCKKLMFVAFNAHTKDHHIIVSSNKWYDATLHAAQIMPLQKVVRPLTGAWEDAQGEARERQEREERARKEEWERMARDREETLRREEDMRRQMPAIYAKWKQRCNNAFSAQPKTLMEFPHPPLIICYCTDILCTLAKSQQGALQVCQHEMHRLLMRSGEYSMKMLREWRNGFHSDKFPRLCDPIYRPELEVKATTMCQILNNLIAEETG